MSPIDTLRTMLETGDARPAAAERFAVQHQKSHPDDAQFVFDAADAFFEYEYPRAALKLLRKLEMRIPHDPRVMEYLGDAHWHNQDPERAEQWYHRSLAATAPNDSVSRSRRLTGLGDALWDLHEKIEALECWKEAVQLDPQNQDAAWCLEAFTNEYGAPKALNSMFDDLNAFRQIQFTRWETLHGGPEPPPMDTVNAVLQSIMLAYNTHIVPVGTKLDTMTTEEKVRLFESVEIDWNAAGPIDNAFVMPSMTFEDERTTGTQELLDIMGERDYDFLPKHGMFFVIHARAALMAAGIDWLRLVEILNTGTATPDEQQFLQWGLAMSLAIGESMRETDLKKQRGHMREALTIAAEVLPRPEAADIVQEVFKTLVASLPGNRGTAGETVH